MDREAAGGLKCPTRLPGNTPGPEKLGHGSGCFQRRSLPMTGKPAFTDDMYIDYWWFLPIDKRSDKKITKNSCNGSSQKF
jgi:hypothetical protein